MATTLRSLVADPSPPPLPPPPTTTTTSTALATTTRKVRIKAWVVFIPFFLLFILVVHREIELSRRSDSKPSSRSKTLNPNPNSYASTSLDPDPDIKKSGALSKLMSYVSWTLWSWRIKRFTTKQTKQLQQIINEEEQQHGTRERGRGQDGKRNGEQIRKRIRNNKYKYSEHEQQWEEEKFVGERGDVQGQFFDEIANMEANAEGGVVVPTKERSELIFHSRPHSHPQDLHHNEGQNESRSDHGRNIDAEQNGTGIDSSAVQRTVNHDQAQDPNYLRYKFNTDEAIRALESNSTVVTMLDASRLYYSCMHKLLRSIREAGDWQGDIVILQAPSLRVKMGAEYDELKQLWESKFRVIFHNATFVDQVFKDKLVKLPISNGPLTQYIGYDKLSMLTDPFLRKYQVQIWIDSDSQVHGYLRWLIELVFKYDTPMIGMLRHSGDHGIDWDKLSKDGRKVLENRKGNFDLAANTLVIQNRKLEGPETMKYKIYKLLKLAGKGMKFAEQSLLSLLWWDKMYLVPQHYRVDANQTCYSGLQVCQSNNTRPACNQLKLGAKGCQFIIYHDIRKMCKESPLPSSPF